MCARRVGCEPWRGVTYRQGAPGGHVRAHSGGHRTAPGQAQHLLPAPCRCRCRLGILLQKQGLEQQAERGRCHRVQPHAPAATEAPAAASSAASSSVATCLGSSSNSFFWLHYYGSLDACACHLWVLSLVGCARVTDPPAVPMRRPHPPNEQELPQGLPHGKPHRHDGMHGEGKQAGHHVREGAPRSRGRHRQGGGQRV